MNLSRPRLAVAAAAAGMMLLSACGATPQRSNPSTSGSLPDSIALQKKFDQNAEFAFGLSSLGLTWDPILAATDYTLETLKPVYDRLLLQGADGTIGPMLATKYVAADDGSSMTLTLREGLTFSDGTAFNADAVKFNLDRARGAGSKIANQLHMVTNVEVIDQYTVKIAVDGWIGSLPYSLSSLAGVMVSPDAAAKGNLATAPVGIGPYVLDEYVSGDHARLTPSANYWDSDAQRVAVFTFRHMPDDQTRLNALLSGQIDGALVRPDQMSALKSADMQVLSKPSTWFVYLNVNTSVAPFDDVEARKALNMAIDRQDLADGLYDGYCTPQVLPFVEGSAAYGDKVGDGLKSYPYDPDAAKKDLAKNEATPGPFEITTLSITIYTKLAEILQEQLKAVGMGSSVSPSPAAEVVEKFGINRTAPMSVSVSAGTNDPSLVIQRWIAPGALHNPGALPNAEIMKYAAEAAGTLDSAKSEDAYEKLAEAWIETPPNLIPICNVHQMTAFSSEVSGVSQTSMGNADLRGVAVTPA